MTLTSTTTKIQYNGDGSTVSFPITFIYWLNADIKVIHKDAAGTETTWVDGTQYTLTGGEGSTGTLTVEVSPTDYTPASGETLTIKSIVPNTQTTTLPLGGALPSSSIEERLDKNVRLIQQREEELDRAPKFSEASSTANLTIPEPVTGEFLRWAGGPSLENVDLINVTGSLASSVDETGSSTSKNKMVSDLLARGWENSRYYVSAKDHGAVGDGVRNFDGAITTGTPNFTSALAGFTSADVGKPIVIQGAGASGDYLASTISAFVSSTAVTLADNASATVSGKKYVYATDDSTAIKAAITAASSSKFEESNNVWMPPGIYGVTESINVPKGVGLIGAGSRVTSIEWLTDSLTNFDEGVVQSIDPVISGTPVIMFSVRIKGMKVEGNGLATTAWATRGWQENCIAEDIVAVGGKSFLFRNLPITETTHLATFKDFHVLSDPFSSVIGSLIGMDIQDTENCNFRNFTIAQGPDGSTLGSKGLRIDGNSVLNTFTNFHCEDFDIAFEDNGQSNIFTNLTTWSGTIGSATSGYKNINAGAKYVIIGMRSRGTGYTNHIEDTRETIVASADLTTVYHAVDAVDGNITNYSKHLRQDFFKGLKVQDVKHHIKDTQLHLQGPTGQGWQSIAIQGGLLDPRGITSSSVANPTNILFSEAHGLTTGDKVTVSGHTGSTPALDGEHIATVVDSTNITVPVNVTVGGTGGTGIQTKYLVINLGTASANGFAGKVEISSTGDQRYFTERSFSGQVAVGGAINSAKGGTQVGSSTTELTIGIPEADAAPATGIFRIPVTNNDATFSQSIDIKITINTSLATTPVATLV